MMRNWIVAALAGVLALASLPASGQQIPGCPLSGIPCTAIDAFVPTGSASLSASTSSTRVALGTSGGNLAVLVTNGGAVTAYVALGSSSVTATTSSTLVPAGGSVALPASTATYLAGITGSSTAALTIRTGTGWPTIISGGAIGVNILSGGGTGGTASSFGAAYPATGTAAGASDGTNMAPILVDGSGNVLMNCATGCSGSGLAQGSTTLGQEGGLTMGAVTTAAPTYTTAKTNPLSLTTGGALRTADASVVTALGTPMQASGGSVTANLGTIGAAATAAAQASQLTQATTTATGVGAPADSAWAGSGSGSIIAVLKSLYTSLGQSVMATSLPVAIASNQSVIPVGGTVATNVAITQNPLNLGAQAVSSENTAVTATRQVQLVSDLVGKQIVLPYANPENFVSGVITSAMTGTTSTSLIAAPASGLRNYITQCTFSNAHATQGTVMILQDGSGGTTLYSGPAAPAFGGATITFPTPLRQPTTATALYVQNVTTGASTFAACSGYKGA